MAVQEASERAASTTRLRTRTFAADCLLDLPALVGPDPRHFDPLLAQVSLLTAISNSTLFSNQQPSLSWSIPAGSTGTANPEGQKFRAVPSPLLCARDGAASTSRYTHPACSCRIFRLKPSSTGGQEWPRGERALAPLVETEWCFLTELSCRNPRAFFTFGMMQAGLGGKPCAGQLCLFEIWDRFVFSPLVLASLNVF